MPSSHRFRAMGCDVVVAGATPRVLDEIERLFEEREATFSRFRPGSELNRVNASAGEPTVVSHVFAEMLQLALDALRTSGGLVDPRLGAHLEAAGYDRDSALLGERGSPKPVPAPPAGTIRVDGRTVLVPAGTRLDLNGVVKGRTVDEAAALLRGTGFVSAGGDLATRGQLVVALPVGGKVTLVQGALATSGTNRRRWSHAGAEHHHLLDPRSGRPSLSRWSQVTVCATSCVGADIAAKAAFLLDAAGPAWLDAHGLPGRFVSRGGCVVANRTWTRSVATPLPCT